MGASSQSLKALIVSNYRVIAVAITLHRNSTSIFHVQSLQTSMANADLINHQRYRSRHRSPQELFQNLTLDQQHSFHLLCR
jgi:hypothetical protein